MSREGGFTTWGWESGGLKDLPPPPPSPPTSQACLGSISPPTSSVPHRIFTLGTGIEDDGGMIELVNLGSIGDGELLWLEWLHEDMLSTVHCMRDVEKTAVFTTPSSKHISSTANTLIVMLLAAIALVTVSLIAPSFQTKSSSPVLPLLPLALPRSMALSMSLFHSAPDPSAISIDVTLSHI
ncbi:hypothetical protein DXG01_007105 [Tephrocybe rancida]|nr:hypothetical protein DXG01_007105 [Tephrocybe rancida]